jgi:hypothetical protein
MVQMGIESLKANLSNPARVYLWDVVIPAPVGGGNPDTFSLRCQTTSIPGKNFDPIPTVNYKQTAGAKYHGRLRYDQTWDMTFIEGEDAAIFQSFHDWCQQQINDRDGVGIDDISLKSDIIMRMLTSGGEEWLAIKLVGCYVQSMADVAMSYDTNDVVKFTVTMSFDRWEQL